MPFDPNDKAKVLYDAVSKDYDLGTYDEFKTKLQDPSKRKVLFDAIGQDYDLGDYNTFNQKLGFDSNEIKYPAAKTFEDKALNLSDAPVSQQPPQQTNID